MKQIAAAEFARLGSAGNKLDTDLVTLSQAAALVCRSKRALEKYKHKPGGLPPPDIKGGRGKPDLWKWSTIRPFLHQNFRHDLPETFPGNRR
jgi:hypothetical protein